MTLRQFILAIAQKALEFPEIYQVTGHNGPYLDPETEIRNKGHWLITFAACFHWTGEEAWRREVAKNASIILADIESRPNGNFYHRDKPGKDRCNGLIGPAWSIEALVAADSVLDDPALRRCATEVFLRHPWNATEGLWNRVEPDGSVLSIDATFNHQLWFAYAGAMLDNDGEESAIRERTLGFLDKLDKNLTIQGDGLIWHPLAGSPSRLGLGRSLSIPRRAKKLLRDILSASRRRRNMLIKSVGYQGFNLLAFAGLRQAYPDHPFWASKRFRQTIEYIQSDAFHQQAPDNPYGNPYNALGWEIPVALSYFADLAPQPDRLQADAQLWVNDQFERTFDQSNWMFARNNADPVTLTARLYEAVRLPEYELDNLTVPLFESDQTQLSDIPERSLFETAQTSSSEVKNDGCVFEHRDTPALFTQSADSDWKLLVILDSSKALSADLDVSHASTGWRVLDLSGGYVSEQARADFEHQAASMGLNIDGWNTAEEYGEADREAENAFLDWLAEVADRPLPGRGTLKKRFHWNRRLSLWWLTGLSQRKLNKTGLFRAFRAHTIISHIVKEAGSEPAKIILFGGSTAEQNFAAAACCQGARNTNDVQAIKIFPNGDRAQKEMHPLTLMKRFVSTCLVIIKQTIKLKKLRKTAAERYIQPTDVVLVSVNLTDFQPNTEGRYASIYLPNLEKELNRRGVSSGWLALAEAASRIPEPQEVEGRVPSPVNASLAPSWGSVAGIIFSGFGWVFQYFRLFGRRRGGPHFEWNGIDLDEVVQADLARVCFGNGLRLCHLASCFEAAFKRLKPRTVVTTLPFNSHCMMAHVSAPSGALVVGLQPGMINTNQFGFRYRAKEVGDRSQDRARFIDHLPAPDIVAAFGYRLRNFMAETGFPRDRVVPVGSPRLDPTLERCMTQIDGRLTKNQVLRHENRSKLGAVDGDKVVVLLGQWVDVAHEWLAMLDQALARLGFPCLIVFKPHPLTIDQAPTILGRFEAGELTVPVRLETEDTAGLLLAADAAVTHSSSTGLEALLLETPLVLIESPGLPDSSDLFTSSGVAPACHTVHELSEALRSIFSEGTPSPDWDENRGAFLDYELFRADGHATQRFASLVTEGVHCSEFGPSHLGEFL